MRTSPSLRTAFDQIGGSRYSARDAVFDGDGEPVDLPGMTHGNGTRRNSRSPQGQRNGIPADDDVNGASTSDQRSPLSTSLWREEPATPRQLAYLHQLDVDTPEDPSTSSTSLSHSGQTLTRGQASDLITQARRQQRQQTEMAGNGAANDQSQPVNQELANRFTSLEQALATLTEALTNPDGTGRTANRQAEERSDESTNGPIPDWLREEDGQSPDGTAGEDEVQNVNIVSAAPDPTTSSGQALDRDGREDKYETDEAGTTRTIRLEPYGESRRQAVHSAIESLQEPDSVAGQVAHRTLVVYTGQRNADLIQEAVGQHTATAVQEATTATADLVAQYHDQGMDGAAVLAAFQSGEAAAAIREAIATPLSDEQLSAVADMVLLPQRRLTCIELDRM